MTAEPDITRTWVGVAKCSARLPVDPEQREEYLLLVSARTLKAMPRETRARHIAHLKATMGEAEASAWLEKLGEIYRRHQEPEHAC